MDLVLDDKIVEENMEDAGTSVDETPDLKRFHNKVQPVDEAANSIVLGDSSTELSRLTVLPVSVSHEELQFPTMNFSSPGPSSPSNISGEHCLPTASDVDHDDANKSICSEGPSSPLADYHTHNEKEVSEYVGLSSELLNADYNESFNNQVETEAFDPPTDNPAPDFYVEQTYEVADILDFDPQIEKSLNSNELLNGDLRKTADISNETFDRVCSEHAETKEDYNPIRMIPSDNGGTKEKYSGLQSPKRPRDDSPDRELSVSPVRSPRNKHSERTEKRPANDDVKMKLSQSPSRRKRSASPEKQDGGHKRASSRDRAHPSSPSKRRRLSSPEKHGGGRRASSRDRSSPSLRRRSPSDKMARRDSHRRGDSPRKRSASPRRRVSPQRKDRSASRSPVRRKDSSGHRRDYRGRSRSRSPYSRDSHRRSPRRRHSPRRRSPLPRHHSHRRSPRKPWSPPANRNTGIGRPGNNLFVAGFSYGTTERDLEKKFSSFGRVTDVRVVRDRRTGDSRGFGFLSFEKDEDADDAIRAIDQTEWNGRIVLVEKSKSGLR